MMCIYRKDRTNAIRYIQNIIKEYDYLEISSPEISSDLIKQLKQEIDRDDNIKNKNIMPNNTFREIEVFVDKNENNNENNKNENIFTINDYDSSNTDKDDNRDYSKEDNENQKIIKNDTHKFKINNMQNLEEIHNCFRIDGDLSEKDNITLHDIQQYKNNGLNLQTQYEMTRFMHHHS